MLVSQNVEKDRIAVKVLPKTFELDKEIIVDMKDVDNIVFDAKVSKQVTAEQM